MCESPRRGLGLQEPQIASICTSAVAKLCTIWWRDQELCTWLCCIQVRGCRDGPKVRWVQWDMLRELDALSYTSMLRPAYLGDLPAMLWHVPKLSLRWATKPPVSQRQQELQRQAGQVARIH